MHLQCTTTATSVLYNSKDWEDTLEVIKILVGIPHPRALRVKKTAKMMPSRINPLGATSLVCLCRVSHPVRDALTLTIQNTVNW